MNKKFQNNKAPIVYVIILSYNGLNWLENCIESVLNSDYSNFKIIYVDNASKDESVDFIRMHYPGVEVLANRKNLGFTGGMNTGIRHALAAEADYVFLLNEDTYLDAGCLRELMAVAQAHEKLGLLAPVQFRYGSPELHKVFQRWLKNHLGVEAQTRLNEPGPDYYEVPDASGAAMLISLKALKIVGLLDAQYFIYFEETDLCRRLRFHGFKIGLCPTAHFWHAEELAVPWKSMLLGRSHLIYTLKDPFHPPGLNVFRALDILIRNLCISAVHFDISNLSFMMQSCGELARHFGEILTRRRAEMVGFADSRTWWRYETDKGGEARGEAALRKMQALLDRGR